MTRRRDALAVELVRLERDLDATIEALADARRLSRDLRTRYQDGHGYAELLVRTSRQRPVERIRRAIERLGARADRVRRAEMATLRSEGLTLTEIGQRFGISHQRVSQLLRQSDTPT